LADISGSAYTWPNPDRRAMRKENTLHTTTLHRQVAALLVLAVCALVSTAATAKEAHGQQIQLQVVSPEGGGQCQVQATFKDDHDNCKSDKAGGRNDCAADAGCACIRKEKRLTWKMEDKKSFELRFGQGSANPFASDGDHKCNLKSNKEGKLRCRVKAKGVPDGIYRYSIHAMDCKPATAQIKVY